MSEELNPGSRVVWTDGEFESTARIVRRHIEDEAQWLIDSISGLHWVRAADLRALTQRPAALQPGASNEATTQAQDDSSGDVQVDQGRIRNADSRVGTTVLELTQRPAAQAGEREAFEAWATSVGYHTERDMFQRDKYQSTATALISLLADIRKACGDNGKRMQTELVEFIGAMPTERDRLREEVERLRADMTVPTIEPNSQNWQGMDGAIAFHLIERHADSWADAARMMHEWRDANAARTTHKETE